MTEIWKHIRHPEIKPIYEISSCGRIKNLEGVIFNAEYKSSNGYDYSKFLNNEGVIKLYPIDEIVALTFINVDFSLTNIRLELIHKDGNTRNSNVDNLMWIPSVERWVDLHCPIMTKKGIEIDVIPDVYLISNKGNVYNKLSNEFIKTHVDNGYLKINLRYSDDYKHNAKIHRAIMISFNVIGRTKKRNFINHIDGNRSNCSIKNMEWCSNQENVQHSFEVGLEVNPAGQYHPRAKFTDNQRECIYEIIKTLKDIQPSHITGLIRRRLPRITRDDVKYAKSIIKKTEKFGFPDLSNAWKEPQIFTDDEYNALVSIVDAIFDKYGIYQTEEYYNEYTKENKNE